MKTWITLCAVSASFTLAVNSLAQVGIGSSIEPEQPTVTKPIEPTRTRPESPSSLDPTGPAVGEAMGDTRQQSSRPQMQTDNQPATSSAVVEQTTVDSDFDRRQASAEERVRVFDTLDANNDLRLQWRELREQNVGIDREMFKQLDKDDTGDLDRGEFVGVSH